MLKGFLSRFNGATQQASIKVEDLGDGITAFRLHSRWTRMLGLEVSFYRVGDLLVDTGFAHASPLVLQALENATISAICCTHHHEDHTGNAGVLAERHGCPVVIYQPEHLETEGLDRLLPYRRLFWGMPGPFRADPMNERVVGREAELEVISAPGHSQTHVALFEPVSRTVFVGDLFVTPGASGVMTHENPYLLVESLRRVAALEPRRMLTGHGRDVHDPVGPLKGKADAIERAAAESQRLIEEGVRPRAVARRVFPKGRRKDRMLEILTQGEFSRLNFVRAAVKHGREQK
ncbi:MAG: MBL fold metallo-hydrolase [Acidobacteria bacterium]|nr:MBL fold metallo-hydrolase [Acidobacteriota bacterium]